VSGKHRRSAPEPGPAPDLDVATDAPSAPVITAAPASAAPASAALSGPTIVARRNRDAERAARRRAGRRRRLLGLAVVLVLLLGAGGSGWLLSDHGSTGTARQSAPVIRQRTLLVQVAGADGAALGSALLGVKPDGSDAASMLIPSRLFVDVPGSGAIPFGDTLALPASSAPADALTDLLGVSVSGSWVLTQQGLAALVDKVGGVQADVDVDVQATDAAGRRTIVVRSGPQRLAGTAAAAYATYAAAGEPEQARLARFNDVLDGVLRAMPGGAGQISAAVAALGAGSRSTMSQGALADVLATFHGAAAKDDVVSGVLPVNEIDTGAAQQAYGIDAGQAGMLVRSRFAGALQQGPAGAAIRVLVENGAGTPGLVEKARQRLVDAGLRFVNGGNAAEFGFARSVVLISDGTARSQEQGRKVAAALGLSTDSIEISTRGQTVAEVIVILGRDFRP
jgi:anionic cell wall polymer biosynthesis LytR-Cps2A-Psr (LCP) family protein